MKFKTIPCPFCKTGHAHITYEENRVYQLNCPDCGNVIFRKDKSWDAAVEFFERMMISNGWIPVTERLPEPGVRVLATDGGFVGEFYINKRGQWQRYNVNDSSLLMTLDILSWMPLPEAPKEGE